MQLQNMGSLRAADSATGLANTCLLLGHSASILMTYDYIVSMPCSLPAFAHLLCYPKVSPNQFLLLSVFREECPALSCST